MINRQSLMILFYFASSCLLSSQQLYAQSENNVTKGFKGKINKRYEESVEDWPEQIKAPANAPNILIWLVDDLGFSHSSAYGGPIETPTLNALAKNGLRYNNFHTTALCSPSRAALLAGRNHHSIGMGSHAITAMGFPGYNGRVPKSAGSMARILQNNGYTTYALGKWDHTPGSETTIVGPFERWPTGEGFDHFYGFHGFDANNMSPAMWQNHTPISPAKNKADYHLTKDLADQAIHYITAQKSINPNRPFFMFWATAAVHAPHHAPQSWLEKYRGKFDDGWDVARERIFKQQKTHKIIPKNSKLTSRLANIPAWDSLSYDERKLYARQMEAFAAQLAHADQQFGRIVESLRRTGQLDNTLILVLSDNGASAEGGLAGSHNEVRVVNGMQTPLQENLKKLDQWGSIDTNNHYHAGWASVGNTPFQYFKQTSHRGGQHGPLIASWPKGIKNSGAILPQYHHIIDIAPTVLEVTGIRAPQQLDGVKQQPIDGISLAYTFKQPTQPDQRTEQYYELLGNRAIYKDGWKAVTIHANRMPWDTAGRYPFDDDQWSLYHVAEDFSESKDLAAQYPEKLQELKQRWDQLAKQFNVYPLYDDIASRIKKVKSLFGPKAKTFTFYPPGATRIAEDIAPPVKNRDHTINAQISGVDSATQGVLAAAGGMYGGYSFYIHNKQLCYSYNFMNEVHKDICAKLSNSNKAITLSAQYRVTGKGQAYIKLMQNQRLIGEGDIKQTIPAIYSVNETFDVGQDTVTPVTENYVSPNKFTGTLSKLVIQLD